MEISYPVSQVLQQKGSQVFSVGPTATVYEAIAIMSEKGVGALLVLEAGRLAGFVSERDYARKVILRGRSSRETLITEIMSTPVISVPPDTSIEECMRIMTSHRIRHLPVLDADRVAGIISIGDLVKWIVTAQAETIRTLRTYIAGAYPA